MEIQVIIDLGAAAILLVLVSGTKKKTPFQ